MSDEEDFDDDIAEEEDIDIEQMAALLAAQQAQAETQQAAENSGEKQPEEEEETDGSDDVNNTGDKYDTSEGKQYLSDVTEEAAQKGGQSINMDEIEQKNESPNAYGFQRSDDYNPEENEFADTNADANAYSMDKDFTEPGTGVDDFSVTKPGDKDDQNDRTKNEEEESTPAEPDRNEKKEEGPSRTNKTTTTAEGQPAGSVQGTAQSSTPGGQQQESKQKGSGKSGIQLLEEVWKKLPKPERDALNAAAQKIPYVGPALFAIEKLYPPSKKDSLGFVIKTVNSWKEGMGWFSPATKGKWLITYIPPFIINRGPLRSGIDLALKMPPMGTALQELSKALNGGDGNTGSIIKGLAK